MLISRPPKPLRSTITSVEVILQQQDGRCCELPKGVLQMCFGGFGIGFDAPLSNTECVTWVDRDRAKIQEGVL
jgi:hypothetical protein